MAGLERRYRHVRFYPWIGKQYKGGKKFGIRLLVLGESHYKWEPRVPPRNETCRIIKKWIANSERPNRFHTKIATAVLNKTPSPEETHDFWHAVAFYNYIQEHLPKPRIRPTSKMWAAAEPAFIEILNIHKPECILVFGKQLWNRMPSIRMEGPKLSVGKSERDTRLYPISRKHHALASCIRHPSSWGFSPRGEHSGIMALLTAARKNARRRQ